MSESTSSVSDLAKFAHRPPGLAELDLVGCKGGKIGPDDGHGSVGSSGDVDCTGVEGGDGERGRDKDLLAGRLCTDGGGDGSGGSGGARGDAGGVDGDGGEGSSGVGGSGGADGMGGEGDNGINDGGGGNDDGGGGAGGNSGGKGTNVDTDGCGDGGDDTGGGDGNDGNGGGDGVGGGKGISDGIDGGGDGDNDCDRPCPCRGWDSLTSNTSAAARLVARQAASHAMPATVAHCTVRTCGALAGMPKPAT